MHFPLTADYAMKIQVNHYPAIEYSKRNPGCENRAANYTTIKFCGWSRTAECY